MAEGFLKCERGVYFATVAAATNHKCTSGTQSVTEVIDDDQRTMFQCEDCGNYFNDFKCFGEHSCCKEEKSGKDYLDPVDKDTTAADKGTAWNHNQTMLLISLYKQYESIVSSGKMRKKMMWEKIASSLRSKEYFFTVDQISGRWKSLTRAYKNVKNHNSKSGNSRKSFEYESDLDDIFGSDPSIVHEHTLSSSKRDDEQSLSDSRSSSPNLNPPQKKAKKASSSKEIVEVFRTHLDQKQKEELEMERCQKMHEEKMAIMNNLVAAIANTSHDLPRHSPTCTSKHPNKF